MSQLISNYELLKKYVSGERNFAHVNLNLIDLNQAIIREANFLASNFNLANLQSINLSDSCLDSSYLIGCNLKNSTLKRTSFQNACLVGANLQQACLEESNLQAADLKGVNLQKAYLHKAHLYQADLRKAQLQQSLLDGAYLDGAYYDDTTKFDRDFNPVKAGMVLVDKKQDREQASLAEASKLLANSSATATDPSSTQNVKWSFLKEDIFKDPQIMKQIFQQYQGRYYLLNKIGHLLKTKSEKFAPESPNNQ
jgi:hypothetical protein